MPVVISRDRRRGMLIGLAVGDALGAAVEFSRPGTFEPVTGYRSGGPHGLEQGEWTDDTSMALALADSIAHVGWNLDDQANRYLAWYRNGRYSVNGRLFDIGITTSSALKRFEQTGKARTSGDLRVQSSGNGSIMRLAPIPIHFASLFPENLEQFVELAIESSLPTHASPQCLSACAYLGLVLCGLVHGLPREVVLDSGWEPVRRLQAYRRLDPEILKVVQGSYRQKHPPEIRGSGHVVKSLEAALWAFHASADFEEAVLRAVNLGDDADTTGAVCGQLAGAHWGESGIPENWRSELAQQALIEGILERLMA